MPDQPKSTAVRLAWVATLLLAALQATAIAGVVGQIITMVAGIQISTQQ